MNRTTKILEKMEYINKRNKEICKKYGKKYNTNYKTKHYSEFTELKAELKGRLDREKEILEIIDKIDNEDLEDNLFKEGVGYTLLKIKKQLTNSEGKE